MSYLGPGPALLALLPWFSFRTLEGEGGKERKMRSEGQLSRSTQHEEW